MEPNAIDQKPFICPAVSEHAKQSKQMLLSEIGSRMPDLATQIAQQARGTTYRVVMSQPFGNALNPRADGLYDAFVKAPDGKIVAVARLEKLGPQLLSSVSMLAGQAMLAQISGQLTKLQADVDLLMRLQIAEDLGEIKAAIRTLQTIHFYEKHRDQILVTTVTSLKKAIGVATEKAVVLMKAVPEPPAWNLTRTFWDSSNETVEALSKAQTAVVTILVGLQALGEAELLLNGAEAAANILRYWLESTRETLDLSRCEELGRRVPAREKTDRHELFWMHAATLLDECASKVRASIEDDIPQTITISCTASEMLEVQ